MTLISSLQFLPESSTEELQLSCPAFLPEHVSQICSDHIAFFCASKPKQPLCMIFQSIMENQELCILKFCRKFGVIMFFFFVHEWMQWRFFPCSHNQLLVLLCNSSRTVLLIYEIWSYVEMSANWSSLHVNYKPGWERLIAQPRTSQRGNQYKTSFVFELEKVQDVQTNYTKRINSANQPKYLFDPRKDIHAKLFTQTPLMKTDLAYWSVMMLTQREVFLKGGLSLFLMSCHIKTSEGQQQTAAWMSGTLWELKTD